MVRLKGIEHRQKNLLFPVLAVGVTDDKQGKRRGVGEG
jgi:hypothetical protein